LEVLGFGEEKTPEAFRNACHKFILTEILRPAAPVEKAPLAPGVEASNDQATVSPPRKAKPKLPKKFMLDALELSGDDAGWAHIGTFGSYLTKLQPDFDSRLYGFKKLSDLVRAKTDIFSTEERVPAGQTQKVLYVRAKG